MGVIALLWGFFASVGLAQTPAVVDERAEPEASGGLLPGGKGPIETIEEEVEKTKTEEELRKEAQLKAYDEQQRALVARVVVLQWRDTDTDYTNEALQRNVRNRIARPDAKFFPDVDMYNPGRVEPDPSVRPVDQRASPPSENIAKVLALVEDTAAIPYNGMSEQDWNIRADELREMANQLWFIDRAELREPIFLLYAQMGKAAENANQGSPPFYENVDGRTVNYYWYLAGSMAQRDPALLAKISDQELYQNIANYKDQLDAGQFRKLTLSFDLNDAFEGRAFAGEYTLYINGIEETVSNPRGLFEVPLGINDVYLKRIDGGYSLAARVERQGVDKGFEFLRQDARKRMGLDLIEQLMENPSECIPELDGDIVNYLAIYAKLHPEADIYITVPQGGSTAPGRIFLWRWDRTHGYLKLVEDNTGGFPIRFAALIGGGVAFSGVKVPDPDDQAIQDQLSQPPGTEGIDPKEFATAVAPIPQPTLEGVPVYYQLRGHFNRLMFGVGMEFKVGTSGQPFYDLFQTDHNKVIDPSGEFTTTTPTGTDGQGNALDPVRSQATELRERELQRLVYALGGVVLGKDAAIGFGPRGYMRVGWYNVPHAVDLTAHLGITPKGPATDKDEERRGRVRALLDIDGFGGAMIPIRDSLYVTREGFLAAGKPRLTFGFTAGVGLTF